LVTQNENPFGQDVFRDFLEQEPRTAFFSFQNQFGRSPHQRRFFQGQFQDIYNEYLGALGSQIRSGQAPTKRFAGFLENLPFTNRFSSLPPTMRPGGGFSSRFAPRSRFLTF